MDGCPGSPAAVPPGMIPGWHTRGYLPHFEAADTWQAITYRLADAMPNHVLAELDMELSVIPANNRGQERRRRIEAWTDAGHGSCLLHRAEAAQIVWDNWRHFASQRYDIGPWVIMPNHVHILIRVHGGWSLESIVRSWKSYSAKRLMAVTGVSAPVWLEDYWDRFIRDERHWQSTRAYIENNPVMAGLVSQPEDWPWSSVGIQRPGDR
jgi:REP element-mobilizing transposase RayT